MNNSSTDITRAHPDIRLALAADLERIQRVDESEPPTIAELIAGDHWLAQMGRDLVEAVGSVEALEHLDAEPLTEDTTGLQDVDSTDAILGEELIRLVEDAQLRLDPEMTTIIRRIIRQLIAAPDRPLRRNVKAPRLAAAVAWVALKANGQLGRGTRRSAADLWFAFGVSDAQTVARSLLESLFAANCESERPSGGFERDRPNPVVADAGLLHSFYRRQLLERRDSMMMRVRTEHAHSLRERPVRFMDDQFSFACEPTSTRWAHRTITPSGQSIVMVSLNDFDEMQLLALPIPEARRLIAALEHALDQPVIGAA